MEYSEQINQTQDYDKGNKQQQTGQIPNANKPSAIGQTVALVKYFFNSKKLDCRICFGEIFIPLAVLAISYIVAIVAHHIAVSEKLEETDGIVRWIPSTMAVVQLLLFFYYMTNSAELLLKEKELRMLMQLMGLKKFTYYMGISFSMLCYLIPVSLLFGVACIIFANAFDVTISIIEFPLFFIIYPIQLTSAIFLFASTSQKAVALVIMIIYFICAFSVAPANVFASVCNYTSERYIFILMILAHFTPTEATRQMIYGLSYSNGTKIFKSDCSHYNYPPTTVVVLMMTLWSVIFYSFAWYLDEICPWQTSRSPKSPLYCLKMKNKQLAASDSVTTTSSIKDPFEGYNPKYFEKAPGTKLGIYIDNVTKKFANSLVVDTLSFSIYSGQTTLLLGHNGAGKTTLMNMIIGVIAPDDGKLFLGGFDIDTRSDEARSSLGLCPQQSILSEKLTLDEHLDLFACIKSGFSGVMKLQHIDMIVKDLNLEEHRKKMCSELSGGMKRKLSLALALVGDSKVLILDEPSSGLDPESRRGFWDCIRQYRSRRTVLLSTQHMEEADYLGDRIAIMSAGKIVCCGSSMFLKKSLGSAYKLRIECKRESRVTIAATICNHFPKAKTDTEQSRSSHINDITIELIADADRQDDQLIGMFEEIESRKDSLGIISFGLKCSTIEDVFLNSAKIISDDAMCPKVDAVYGMETFANNLALINHPEENAINISSLKLYAAFMKKQLIVVYRDLCTVIIFNIVGPIIIMFILSEEFAQGSRCISQTTKNTSWIFQNSALLLPLSYVAFSNIPAEERANKFKLMQMCSKASYFIYWASRLLVDMPFILLYYIMSVIFLNITLSEEQILMFGNRFELYSSMLILIIPFGLASLLLIYLMSNYFDIYFIALTSIFTDLLHGISLTNFPWISRVIEYVSSAHTFTSTLQEFKDATFDTDGCKIDSESHLRHGSHQILYIGAIILILQALSFAITLYFVETRRIDITNFHKCSNYCIDKRPCRKESLDEDVKIEERRAEEILSNPSIRAKNALVSENLTKSYTRSIRAVDGLTFAVDKAECFGLLGANGAGKTTAFSMLSGDIFPDHGSIVCNNLQMSDNVDAYSENIGFDPQASPSTAYLTSREAMYFIARLRGIEESRIGDLVNASLFILSMQEHADKLIDKLSGGTRRKLSLGLALIGVPQVLMLDEPTAGIDPVARRKIWLTLAALKSKLKTSIIISSHAMEECEAICDRLTIMVNGRMRCIGSFQHLRSKFGQGYMVRMQLDVSSGTSNEQKRPDSSLKEFLSDNLKSLVTIDDFGATSVLYKVHDGKILRSSLFKVLKGAKHTYGNISYLVSDINLEDIFLSLAREQKQNAI